MMEKFELTDKTVLVVGGAGLIGTEVTRGLIEAGASVYLADLPDSGGKELAAQFDRAEFVPLDLTEPDQVTETVELVAKDGDGIDGAVNCSYPQTESYGDHAFWGTDADEWNKNIKFHLGGYFRVARTAARSMRADGIGGSIVNFGSTYGIQAPDFEVYGKAGVETPSEYAAIKAGVTNLTRYMASYLGSEDIRVNTISPGGVFDEQDEEFVENYEERVPLDRMAQPEDISGAVIYLLSDAAGYVTGHNLVVDGGWTIC
jgi:NAD(P)-dependent dehydrogenase (short-subunit alcohol dehydrogenase family)